MNADAGHAGLGGGASADPAPVANVVGRVRVPDDVEVDHARERGDPVLLQRPDEDRAIADAVLKREHERVRGEPAPLGDALELRRGVRGGRGLDRDNDDVATRERLGIVVHGHVHRADAVHVARPPRIRAEGHATRGDLVDEAPPADHDDVGLRAQRDQPADVRAHRAGAEHSNLERHVHPASGAVMKFGCLHLSAVKISKSTLRHG